MARHRAELLEDGGAAVASDEFFRSAEHLAAEGVTHTLRVALAEGELLAPLVLRGIPGGGGSDAISPYGYPGVAAPPGARVEPDEIDWSATGLVSAFLRHRLGPPPLQGASERNPVQIADPELPRKSRASDRQQIRRNERAGLEIRAAPGPEADEDARAGFRAAYAQTMRRAGAAERYLFDADYFARVLGFGGSWLFLALDPGGEVAAASIAVRSDGMLHYYLSGTADAHLRGSPMKNLVAAMCDFAAERGLPVNLGGGIEPGDRLEEFKRGFANRTEPFRTHELVCDPEAYRRLAAGREGTGFFPAYRAGGG